MEAKRPSIYLACSGASNTGAYSDKATRKIAASGNGKMLCLARFAIDENFAEQAKKDIKDNNSAVIILDGCPVNCAEKIMRQRGFTEFRHVNVTDYGIEKGKTPMTEEKISEIVESLIK